MVLLLRHGEPDWPAVNARGWPGAANDFVALTARGTEQAEAAADLLAEREVVAVLSSPMTRALQTAGIVAARLGLGVQVELDLREWLPDETYAWTGPAEVFAAYADMLAHDGVRPAGNELLWEPIGAVRSRALAVLLPYLQHQATVLAVCHEVVIHALTGHQRTSHAGLRELPAGSLDVSRGD